MRRSPGYRHRHPSAGRRAVEGNISRLSAIRYFVRHTLGCTCPDDVLQRIDYRIEQVPWEQRRIAVGGRLLVYVIDAGDDMPVADWLDAALVRGVGERDAEGFNRFRLVLATGRPQALRAVAEPIFHNAHCRDERTHLHVVDAAGVALF